MRFHRVRSFQRYRFISLPPANLSLNPAGLSSASVQLLGTLIEAVASPVSALQRLHMRMRADIRPDATAGGQAGTPDSRSKAEPIRGFDSSRLLCYPGALRARFTRSRAFSDNICKHETQPMKDQQKLTWLRPSRPLRLPDLNEVTRKPSDFSTWGQGILARILMEDDRMQSARPSFCVVPHFRRILEGLKGRLPLFLSIVPEIQTLLTPYNPW